MINPTGHVFINKNYLLFIRKLPCVVTGRAGDNIHPHHADQIGTGAKNDYTCIPLIADIHTGNGHVTLEKLQKTYNLNVYSEINFYNALYIEFLEKKYDLDKDKENGYYYLRRKKAGYFN